MADGNVDDAFDFSADTNHSILLERCHAKNCAGGWGSGFAFNSLSGLGLVTLRDCSANNMPGAAIKLPTNHMKIALPGSGLALSVQNFSAATVAADHLMFNGHAQGFFPITIQSSAHIEGDATKRIIELKNMSIKVGSSNRSFIGCQTASSANGFVPTECATGSVWALHGNVSVWAANKSTCSLADIGEARTELTVACKSVDGAPWRQKRFAIGLLTNYFPGLGPPGALHGYYQAIADLNFTLSHMPGTGANETILSDHLAAAETHGLEVITEYGFLSNSSSPALLGFALGDEPTARGFPTAAKMVAQVVATRPGKLGFENLLPNYATYEQLGNVSYEEYVLDYVAKVKPQLLCWDSYPGFKGNATSDALCAKEHGGPCPDKQGYLLNLSVLRRAAQAARLPMWNYFWTNNFYTPPQPPDFRGAGPSLGQLRWQVFSSLAFGSSGLIYYNNPAGFFVQLNGSDGPVAAHALTVNTELWAYGDILFGASSDFVQSVQPSNSSIATQLRGSELVEDLRGRTNGTYLVGEFTMIDKRKAALVHNQDDTAGITVAVDFRSARGVVQRVEPTTGRLVPLDSETVRLEAGDAAMFVTTSAAAMKMDDGAIKQMTCLHGVVDGHINTTVATPHKLCRHNATDSSYVCDPAENSTANLDMSHYLGVADFTVSAELMLVRPIGSDSTTSIFFVSKPHASGDTGQDHVGLDAGPAPDTFYTEGCHWPEQMFKNARTPASGQWFNITLVRTKGVLKVSLNGAAIITLPMNFAVKGLAIRPWRSVAARPLAVGLCTCDPCPTAATAATAAADDHNLHTRRGRLSLHRNAGTDPDAEYHNPCLR